MLYRIYLAFKIFSFNLPAKQRVEIQLEFECGNGMMLETHMELGMTDLDLLENIFCPKIWEYKPKISQKQGSF